MQKKRNFLFKNFFLILLITLYSPNIFPSIDNEDFDFSALKKLQNIENRPLLKTLPSDKKNRIFIEDDKKKSIAQGTYQVSVKKNALILNTSNNEYYYAPEPLIVNLYLYQDREGYHFIKSSSENDLVYKVHSSEVDSIREYKNLTNFSEHREFINPFQDDESPFKPILDFKIAGKENSFGKESKEVSPHFLWGEMALTFSTKIPYLVGFMFSTQENVSQNSNEWSRKDYKVGLTGSIPLTNYTFKHRAQDLKLNLLYTFSGERRNSNKLESYKGESISIIYHHPFEPEKPQGFNFNIGSIFEWYQIENKLENEFSMGMLVMLGYTFPVNGGNL